jgi:cysteine desulfurase
MTMGPRIYLDFNATAPLRPQARAAMLAALESSGNPSSVHAEGRAARGIVEAGRRAVAALVGALGNEVYFTSGATEAANWVLRRNWRTIVHTGIEHAAVLAPLRANAARKIEVPVDRDGVIDLPRLAATLEEHGSTPGTRDADGLLVLQLANNETGVVQPLAQAARLAREKGFRVFTDAVQGAGRLSLHEAVAGAQFIALSAHKIGGPQGVGALVVREPGALPPFIVGGGQERRMRGGTENVVGIAGFGAAAADAFEAHERMGRVASLRDALERRVGEITPAAVVIGKAAPRLPNTSAIALPGARAETLVIRFDLAGIAVSAGAACSSGKVGGSAVLAAMGIPQDLAGATLRVSLGEPTTEADIEAFLAAWDAVTKDTRLRQAS